MVFPHGLPAPCFAAIHWTEYRRVTLRQCAAPDRLTGGTFSPLPGIHSL
jgi:hypothetical protein